MRATYTDFWVVIVFFLDSTNGDDVAVSHSRVSLSLGSIHNKLGINETMGVAHSGYGGLG